ncbi:MAG TPA: L,D-transpeptidase family protein [Pseudolabrys sp.]|nr:L,D-transpeptidase family protein [Pseudolabrys sp.]
MRSVRFDRLLAGSALALVLALSSHGALAQVDEAQIEAAMPPVDTADVPPPSIKDIGPLPSAAAPPAAADTGTPLATQSAAEHAKPAEQPATAAGQSDAPKAAEGDNGNEKSAAQASPGKGGAAAATSPDGGKATADTASDKSNDAAAPAPQKVAVSAVADQIRQIITGNKLDRIIVRKTDRAGVEAFYRARDYAPLWVTNDAANDRAKAAMAYLAQVDTVGLNPSDYPVPDFKSSSSPDALATDELRLTESVLTYARHAQIGQINFTRVSADIFYKLDAPDPADVLKKLAEASDTRAALDSYNPPQPEFKALEKKLAELRAGGSEEKVEKPKTIRIAEGKILRPGMSDPRVISLRKRLNIPGDKNSPVYDKDVFEAVKDFQKSAGIGADGMAGLQTVRALNGEKAYHVARNPIDTVLVNMERWRWMPRDLGATRVVVNVPDYTLSLYRNNELYWKTKIVVGKPGKATPLITAAMKYITVNPTWNVPPSIIENEYLPALQQDPDALDRIGLKMYQDPDGTVHIYQPPGADNALGRIRFNFPNKFLVYQHDTPDKYLFARAKRAYSHGCMRVQDPLTYAEKLLSIELPNEHYTPAKLEKMFGDNEININFPKPIPVHLTYQTAFVDADGKLQLREDVYGHDAKMIAILKNNSERRIADIAIDRPPDTSSKPVRMPVGMYGGNSGGYYDDGGRGPATFFDFLFGGRPRPYYPPQRRFIGPRAGENGRYSWR